MKISKQTELELEQNTDVMHLARRLSHLFVMDKNIKVEDKYSELTVLFKENMGWIKPVLSSLFHLYVQCVSFKRCRSLSYLKVLKAKLPRSLT